MTRRRRFAIAAAASAFFVVGCERPTERLPLDDRGLRRRPAYADLPQALMLRFQEIKGEGPSRESWEVEVLQVGGDVRVRGSIRTGALSVPILHAMSPPEYMEFWIWLRGFPLDRGRPVENAAEPPAGWRKTLAVDVVLDDRTRWESRTSWTRPLASSAAWVNEIEKRLHDMALDLAHREVDRQERRAASPESGAVEAGAADAVPEGPLSPEARPDDD